MPMSSLVRFVCVAALVATTTGCSSTTIVTRSSEVDIAVANGRLVGRSVELWLVDGGRDTGTIRYLRLDSTSWALATNPAFTASGGNRVVPTTDIAGITTSSRSAGALSGAAVGALIAGSTIAITSAGDFGSFIRGGNFILGVLGAFPLTITGANIGGNIGVRHVYRFRD